MQLLIALRTPVTCYVNQPAFRYKCAPTSNKGNYLLDPVMQKNCIGETRTKTLHCLVKKPPLLSKETSAYFGALPAKPQIDTALTLGRPGP